MRSNTRIRIIQRVQLADGSFNMMTNRRGFTIIELLLTIGLVLLLASLIIVALRGVIHAAKRADTSNALRQMTQAYISYAGDHNYALMPGYASKVKVTELGINPRMGSGNFLVSAAADEISLLNASDASSYVWRLAPYMDNTWATMFVDYRSPELNARLSDEFNAGIYGLSTAANSGADSMGISLLPSIGLNSIYLGGDDVHGSSELRALNPWDNPSGKVAATRMTEVKNPRRIILFGATKYYDQEDLYSEYPDFPDQDLPDGVLWGYGELRPPYIQPKDDEGFLRFAQWHLTYVDGVTTIEVENHFNTTGGGLPAGRWGGRRTMPIVPVSHLDGSVTSEELGVLETDHAMWNPADAVGVRE